MGFSLSMLVCACPYQINLVNKFIDTFIHIIQEMIEIKTFIS